ncbi:LD-carboxypeptidase [Thermosulfurimonas sp. F29]|uniref:S66 peptidase family protein n=1 Tax=Thermosulfurimonas sp. F29 TaxID=2867247 RepID=UPI001C832544|nr:LD-carboxypeptidase [Thermosulfurimonas sp. F29]MBX6422480.1 LD-carboxypeptidase [Thermosulfurimonas sp. F29]
MFNPGDRVIVFAPAGAVREADLETGLDILRKWGLEPRVSETCRSRYRYLAGDDKLRGEELRRLLEEERDCVLWAARGGFGSARLLPRLEDLFPGRKSPILLGFSDLTALLNYLVIRGFRAWHAPTVSFLGKMHPGAREELRRLLFGEKIPLLCGIALREGTVEGPLFGGNLATLSALVGTPYFPELRGAILFLEDTGEALYRLDRYLTHLALAGIFQKIKGLVLGDLGHPLEAIFPILEEILPSHLPVAAGFPLGHLPGTQAFPLGERARLEVRGGRAFLTQAYD